MQSFVSLKRSFMIQKGPSSPFWAAMDSSSPSRIRTLLTLLEIDSRLLRTNSSRLVKMRLMPLFKNSFKKLLPKAVKTIFQSLSSSFKDSWINFEYSLSQLSLLFFPNDYY